MATGSQRYKSHKVWETLQLKREALEAARYDDAKAEQKRKDVVEWLAEAQKTRPARQPALYLSALDELSEALNELQTGDSEFKRYVGVARQPQSPQMIWKLEAALRSLPLPPPKDLAGSYVVLLDKEIGARTERLDQLEARVKETEESLQERLAELDGVSKEVETLRGEISTERSTIAEVSSSTQTTIDEEWNEALSAWRQERQETDQKSDAEAVQHVATLAATTKAGAALAEHAASSLTATDWNARGKRERRAAQLIRAGAAVAFVVAAAVGWFIVNEAIRNDFDLTTGDGILRASVALIIGAFGGLLLRESSRHFREADTAEDVALSLQALAPFYAGSDDDVRLDARKNVGDAVLVRNVLSRFAHRDAAKHAAEVNTAELPSLVDSVTKALKGGQDGAQ